MTLEILSGPGSSFSDDARESFIELAISGGEVTEGTLRTNVPAADTLVFLRDLGELQGVAALKLPQPAYRTSITGKSGVPLTPAAYPVELGYILVAEHAQSRGHSRRLVSEAVQAAGQRGIFATSRADNTRMHATLSKFGFEPVGKTYSSNQHPGSLIQLFLRPAST